MSDNTRKPIKVVVGGNGGEEKEKPRRLEAALERPHMPTTIGMPTPTIIDDGPPRGDQSPSGTKYGIAPPSVVVSRVKQDRGKENNGDPGKTRQGLVVLEGGNVEKRDPNVLVEDSETEKATEELKPESDRGKNGDPGKRLMGIPAPKFDGLELEEKPPRGKIDQEDKIVVPGERRRRIFMGLTAAAIVLIFFALIYLLASY